MFLCDRELEVEWEEHCDDDFVSIHDGPDTKATVLEGIINIFYIFDT